MRHVNSYSLGTSTVLLPYVIADVNVLQTHATANVRAIRGPGQTSIAARS